MAGIVFRLIFWLFILFLALSFFGISIEAIINSPTGQANLAYIAYLIVSGWEWLVSHFQAFGQAIVQTSPF